MVCDVHVIWQNLRNNLMSAACDPSSGQTQLGEAHTCGVVAKREGSFVDPSLAGSSIKPAIPCGSRCNESRPAFPCRGPAGGLCPDGRRRVPEG